MICRISLLVLQALVTHVHAQALTAEAAGDALIDIYLGRALQTSPKDSDLDDTTLGKVSHVAGPSSLSPARSLQLSPASQRTSVSIGYQPHVSGKVMPDPHSNPHSPHTRNYMARSQSVPPAKWYWGAGSGRKGGRREFSEGGNFRGNSRFFLDTADVADWDKYLPLGIFHGIHTNPLLLEQAGVPCTIESLHDLAEKGLKKLGSETSEFQVHSWGDSAKEMYEVGLKLCEPNKKQIVIKVPVTAMGVEAAKLLIKDGVRVTLSAVYDWKQALLAAGVGAEYMVPWLGRMSDTGKDGEEEIEVMSQVLNGLGSDTRVLVSNVGDTNTMARLAQMGLTTFSITPLMAEALFREPMTIATAQELETAARRNGGMKELKSESKSSKAETKTEPEPKQEANKEFEMELDEPKPEPKAKPKAKAKAKGKGKKKKAVSD